MADQNQLMNDEVGKILPFNRIIPNELPILYSDNMAVKFQEGMFVLYFFQNRHPLTFTEEEMALVTAVDSLCVAQIVLTPAQMEKVSIAMTINYRRHQDMAVSTKGESSEES